METAKHCPNCGKELPGGALEGLCPDCMLKVGAAAESAPPIESGAGGTVVMPPPSAPPAPAPPIGGEFGNYKILRRLGHGGMGVVYEAEERDSGRRVALKVISQKLNSPQDRARFLREGRLAASINHPNCVYVYGTEEIEGTPVIAMEFVPGGTLQQRLNREGPLPVAKAVDWVLQVIAGLEAGVAVGILHRDIKPSNCFEDPDGTVKIGDFGLSISTAARAETNITESGALVGTPAFCPPEQLRGEELSARSDMYAVGVTLFHLLTGRLPFEGQTLPQLVANTLEKRPPSPHAYRKEIPNGLARVILRCLDKQPSERFKTYADLSRALEPYASTAPTPATLGLRLLAGAADMIVLGTFGLLATLLMLGDPFAVLDRLSRQGGQAFLMMLPWFVLILLYYVVAESRWGATPGKALCRLRVLQADRNYPRPLQASLRAAIYTLVPMLPYWIVIIVTGDLLALSVPSAKTYLLSASYYLLLALLFVTARRRNGFAAVHDLASRTRVVSRSAIEQRPVLPGAEPQPVGVESKPTVGPYHVLQPLGKSGDAEWLEAYDLRLLRRVLIRKVAAGTPRLPGMIRMTSRVGRLRWLAGRREADDNWDAFEGVGGQPLVQLINHPRSWAQVRFWLHDIARELSVAEADGTQPPVLALDRVWITGEGRAKLLDFPAPGASGSSDELGSYGDTATRAQGFIDQVAAVALGGRLADGKSASMVRGILPVHARRFLEALPTLSGVQAVAAALQPLLRRPAEVTRGRRSMIVTACITFPVVASLAGVLGISSMQSWQRRYPELMQLSNVLNTWRAKQMPFVPENKLPSDQLIGTYIAAHYGSVITNEPIWSSTMARVFIPPDARVFAERSLEEYASPAADVLEQAEKRLKGFARQPSPGNLPSPALFWPFLLWFTSLIYVALPAVIAAFLFRGGLVLLATGVTYVRRDGRRASRGRMLWRSLVAWSPVFGAVALVAVALHLKSGLWALWSVLLVITLVGWSLWLPERGLQDRLAGTWPVPR